MTIETDISVLFCIDQSLPKLRITRIREHTAQYHREGMLKTSSSSSSEGFWMNKSQPPRVVMVSWGKEAWFCWGEMEAKKSVMLSQVVIFFYFLYLHNVFMKKCSNLPSVSNFIVCIKGKESYVYKPIQARAHLKASSGNRQSSIKTNVPNRSPSATTITTQVRHTHSNTTILIQVGIYHNK